MVNYQNAKIYKIVNDELNLTYYGSTCSTLIKRFWGHKCEKINPTKSKILFTTETKAEIFLVEKFPCNDKMELHQRERFYIENNECLNKYIPCRTPKERYEENKEKVKKIGKDYYKNNKEKLKEKSKKYKQDNKEKIKLKKKQYNEKNRDKISEYRRQYYLKQKLLKSQSD